MWGRQQKGVGRIRQAVQWEAEASLQKFCRQTCFRAGTAQKRVVSLALHKDRRKLATKQNGPPRLVASLARSISLHKQKRVMFSQADIEDRAKRDVDRARARRQEVALKEFHQKEAEQRKKTAACGRWVRVEADRSRLLRGTKVRLRGEVLEDIDMRVEITKFSMWGGVKTSRSGLRHIARSKSPMGTTVREG